MQFRGYSLGTTFRYLEDSYTFNEFRYFTHFTTGPSAAFQNAKVTQLTLPPTLVNLGTDFIRGSRIVDFVVPRYIGSMGTRNIYYNSSLSNLVLLSDTLVTFSSYAGTLSSINLYVPDELVSEYQAHSVWKQMRIHPLSECMLTWPSYYNRDTA